MRSSLSVALLVASSTAIAEPAYDSYSLAVEPWGFQESNTGISPRFIQFLAGKTGIAIRTEVRPYLRVQEGMQSGASALTMWIPTPERDRIALKLCQPSTIRISISYLRNAAPSVGTLDWFRGKTIGELRGSHTFDRFDSNVPHNKVLIGDMAQGFRMLKAGHLDGTICVQPGCRNAMTAAGASPAEFGQFPYQTAPIAVYVSRQSGLFKDVAALEKIRAACESAEGKRWIEEFVAQYEPPGE
jgi:polar amino acid transport system substrate-binding protein